MKIRNKIAAIVIGCTVLPLGVGGTIAFRDAEARLTAAVGQRLGLHSREVLVELHDVIDRETSDLIGISRRFVMQEALIDDSQGNINRELDALRDINPLFSDFLVANLAGQIIASTAEPLNGLSVIGKGFFESSRKAGGDRGIGTAGSSTARDHKDRNGDAAGLKLSAHYRGPFEHIDLVGREGIILAAPIIADYDTNSVIGVIAGVLDVETIRRLISKRAVAEFDQDSQHALIIRSRLSDRTFYATEGIDASMASAILGSARDGVRQFQVNNQQFFAGVADPVAFHGSQPEFVAVTLIIAEDALEENTALRRRFVWIGLAITAAASLAGLLLAHFLTGPIVRVTEALRLMRQGVIGERIGDTGSNDEIGIMGQAFDEMAEWREKREKDLHVALEQAEAANLAKNSFLSSMSHELRTPLNAILGFGQLLEMDKENLQPNHLEATAEILRSGNHLLNLITEILNLSLVESGTVAIKLEHIDVARVVGDCSTMITPLARRFGVSVEVSQIDNPPLAVIADTTRLRQMMLNLMSNACKYNRRGGYVKLEWRVKGENVRISIIDNGLGIPLEKQESVFQPFVRLGAEASVIEGSGIGLYFTKKLAALMAGDIGFESARDQGSTFWIDLPRAPDSAAAE